MSISSSSGESFGGFSFGEKVKIWVHFYLAGAVILATTLMIGQVGSPEISISVGLVMSGFMWGGLELGAIHMAGHYAREWWTKLGRMISAGIRGYADHHKGHHKAEVRAGGREDRVAVAFLKEHRATPFTVWIFIVTGHLLLVVPFMATLVLLSFGTWAIIWPVCFWIGILAFYAWYEPVHWVTHWRPSMQQRHPWVYYWLRSTEHQAHHVRSMERFGIYPMFQVIELLPHTLVRLPFDILGLLERLVSLVPFVQTWFDNFIATAKQALTDASNGPADAATGFEEARNP